MAMNLLNARFLRLLLFRGILRWCPLWLLKNLMKRSHFVKCILQPRALALQDLADCASFWSAAKE
jgi:hypothetical protein